MMGLHLHHDGLSRPAEAPRLRVLSLGAGVQSSTLALMAARGELGPMPDFAVFADTQAEPRHVYDFLDYLEPLLPFPLHRVSIGNLEADLIAGFNRTGQRYATIPAFVRNRSGGIGITRRQCTSDYKIDAIEGEVRRRLGLGFGQSVRNFLRLKRSEPTPALVEQWVGISTDEIDRVRTSGKAYIHLRHPLIEARMNRAACERWLQERQYRVPDKSACVFCPFKSNAEWRFLKDQHPAEFSRAVRIDQAIRNGNPGKGLESGIMALHRSLKPLEQIDFSEPDTDQRKFGFANECSGVCGV